MIKKLKLLLYCTKAKPYLRDYRGKAIYNRFVISPNDRPFTSDDTQPTLNGKIVAECDFEVEEIENNVCSFGDYKLLYFETETLTGKEIEDKSCLSYQQLKGYLRDRNGSYRYNGYAIHIKNLHVFDKPKELNEYEMSGGRNFKQAPQNMSYAYIKEGGRECCDIKVLISIHPDWLCKILNGEKTIEVRKKVLKEMLG